MASLPKTYEVLPGRLWIRGRTNHLSPEAKSRLRRELGLRWVVACCPEPDIGWEGTAARYHHWPFADGPKVPPWIEGRAELIADMVRADKPVLIYCNAGRNRSAFMAALVVESVLGISGTEAVRYVQERRPNALANPAFVRYMEAA